MRSDATKEEIAEALARLKWAILGLEAAGVRDFVRTRPPAVAPSPKPAAATARADGSQKTRPPVLPAAPEAASPAVEGLGVISLELAGCTRCRLHEGRGTVVFGEGSDRSGLVFVGEGPGFEEDRQGRPFVGKAGKLLDKMIQALGFGRGDVYICNVVKCRPPDNRTPLADEMEACLPFLFRQIETLKPRLLCALGACASQALVGRSAPISQIRGKLLSWRGFPLICTYHPAYLLRSPAQKAAAWQDLREVRRVLSQKTG
jgi:uracil-DNA glycosylase